MNQEMLQQKATTLRRDIVEMLYKAGSGHPGGSLSAVEIVSALYFQEMNVDVKNPEWRDRDRFVLSKGHAAPVLYAALAEKGFFPKSQLWELRKIGSILQGHPEMKNISGVDMSTGSLGQGFSTAVGMALGLRTDNSGSRVFALLGDGELQEGIVWEAAMAAPHYKLDNLTAFVDYNGLQIDGPNEEVMGVHPVTDKFKAFGWNVLTVDGHDFKGILEALAIAKTTKDKPTMIVARTVKGKGVSFMEDQAGWHGKAPNKEERDQAMTELGGLDHE